MTDDVEYELFTRASRAYARHCTDAGAIAQQASPSCSTTEDVDGRLQYVLRNGYGELARYDVTMQGHEVRSLRRVEG